MNCLEGASASIENENLIVCYDTCIPETGKKTAYLYNFYDGDLSEVYELIDAFQNEGMELYY